MENRPYRFWYILRIVFMLLSVASFSSVATAQSYAPPPGMCTTDPTYNIPNDMAIVTSIVNNITCVLYGPSSGASCTGGGSVSENLFRKIAEHNTFFTILAGAGVLFVIIFALSFLIGIVRLTVMEFMIRAFKISLIVIFISPMAWDFFYNTVGIFFQNGTNWLIAISSKIALGSIPGVDPTRPFLLIDYSIATAFSTKMFISIVAMFLTGPYGWLFALMVFFGLGSFIATLFQAVWIYLMSMVIRAFLFGLAPIFFPFVLFSKTRHLFDGWLNQLVNTMLQPALLFTFFAFFSVLVQAAMNNILKVPVCFMPGSGIFPGAPNDEVLPRFTIEGQPYGRGWGFTGPVDFPSLGLIFPISIMDVLIFVLLTQLAWRFNSISISVAKEISGSPTSYNMPGAFSSMLSSKSVATQNALRGYGDDSAEKRQAAIASGQVGLNNVPAAGANAGANVAVRTPKPGEIPPTR